MSGAIALPVDRPVPGPGLLAAAPVAVDAGRSAPLLVPHGNPFFFDHPLDHVSGMLAICALLDLTSAVTGDPMDQPDRRLLADLTFPAMGDLDQPTELSVTFDTALSTSPDTGPADRYQIRAVQGGAATCAGALELGSARAPSVAPGPVGHTGRCPADLVNRARQANVLLGPPEDVSGDVVVAVHRPPADHYLSGFGRAGYSPRGIVETSRQFLTLLVHQAAGRSLDTKIIWLDFTADVPCAVPDDAALALRWRPEPLRGNRLSVHMELTCGGSRTVLGRFGYRVLAVSPAAYRRFRSSAAGGGR